MLIDHSHMSPTHSYPRGGKWDFVEDMPRIEDISSLTNHCREADDSTDILDDLQRRD